MIRRRSVVTISTFYSLLPPPTYVTTPPPFFFPTKMAAIPVRLKNAMAEMEKRARDRRCDSSGSEHSPEDSTDLFDLVNSYIEREAGFCETELGEKIVDVDSRSISYCFKAEGESLRTALGLSEEDDDCNGNNLGFVKRLLRTETGVACQSIGDVCRPEFKRKLMARLREKGFDAGLCKSRWEKTGRTPRGSYEYVDVYMGGIRYIIEASLVGEFNIVRPTERYLSLLGVIPEVFAGTAEEMAALVKVMSKAAKESMKSVGMTVPPWRREKYLICKWFGMYKRTTNSQSEQQHMVVKEEEMETKLTKGFSPISQERLEWCRYKVEDKRDGIKYNVVVGRLTQVLGDG